MWIVFIGALYEDISPDCVNPSVLLVPPSYIEVSEIPAHSSSAPGSSRPSHISETNVDIPKTRPGLPDLTQSARVLPDITSTSPSGEKSKPFQKERQLRSSGRQQSMSDPSSINVNFKNNLDVRIHSDSSVNNTWD